jgi:uncharacterized protein YecT (DUF1311 family)
MKSHDTSSEAKRLLSEAQESWNTSREKTCDAFGALDVEGGTGFELAKADCTLKMTAQRAAELEKRLPDADRPKGARQQ